MSITPEAQSNSKDGLEISNESGPETPKLDFNILDQNIFTHYGLKWDLNLIYWGEPGRPSGDVNTQGSFLGVLPNKKQQSKNTSGEQKIAGRPKKIDSNLPEEFKDFIGIYVLYSGEQIVYVGETGQGTGLRTFFERIKQHFTNDKFKFTHFSWYGLKKDSSLDEGRKKVIDTYISQVEALLIEVINPPFNKQAGSFKGATKVQQVAHPSSKGDIRSLLEQILNNTKKDNADVDSAKKTKVNKSPKV